MKSWTPNVSFGLKGDIPAHVRFPPAGLLKVASCHQVCSYETLDAGDPESSDSAVIASAAIAMRIELESG